MSTLFILVLDLTILLFYLHVSRVTGVVSGVSITGDPAADEFSDVKYTCTAGCTNGTCSYTWPTVTGLTLSPSANRLTVKNVTRKYGGGKFTITCSVVDTDKSPISATKSLDIYYGPDSVSLSPAVTQTVQENKKFPAAVECTASGCYPPADCSIEWKKGIRVVKSALRLFDTSMTASRSQAGTYECTATNTKKATPTSKSKTFMLIVEYPPDVKVTWNNGTRTLTCTASGVPDNYTYKPWTQSLNNDTIRYLNNKDTYNFTTLSYQDRGDYTCSVSNEIVPVGKSDAWITGATTITPNDKPKLVSFERSYNVSKGSPLAVELYVYANPTLNNNDITLKDNSSKSIPNTNMEINRQTVPVNVMFYTKNIRVSGQKVTATILEVLEEYFGVLQIDIKKGSFDTVTCEVSLYPEGAPDPPEDLKITDMSHDSVTLTFKSGYFNGASQTFVVEYKTGAQGSSWLNGSSVFAGTEKNVSLSAKIGGLSPETYYMFRAYGYNMYDRSDTANILVNVTTLEAPLPLGAIIGGTVGGVVAIVLVIVVTIVIYRWRRSKDGDKKAINRESDTTDGSAEPMERFNNGCMPNEPTYENTDLKNGGPTTSYRQTSEHEHGQVKDEPIYNNQMQQSQSADHLNHNSDQDVDLVAQDGYLQLENGDSGQRVEEAYATKGTPKITRQPSEENYLNIAEFKASKESPPRAHSQEQTVGYLNVSKQIGLLDKDKESADDQESPYLDMDVTTTTKGSHGFKYTKTDSLEGAYVAMDTRRGPSVASKPKPTSNGKSLYQNMKKFGKKPSVSHNQNQESRTAKVRDSVPSFDAPAPPPLERQEKEISAATFRSKGNGRVRRTLLPMPTVHIQTRLVDRESRA